MTILRSAKITDDLVDSALFQARFDPQKNLREAYAIIKTEFSEIQKNAIARGDLHPVTFVVSIAVMDEPARCGAYDARLCSDRPLARTGGKDRESVKVFPIPRIRNDTTGMMRAIKEL